MAESLRQARSAALICGGWIRARQGLAFILASALLIVASILLLPAVSGAETAIPPPPTATPTLGAGAKAIAPAGSGSPPGYVFTQILSTGKNKSTALAMIPGTLDGAVLITQEGDLWKVGLSEPAQTPTPYGNVRDRMTRRGDEGLLGIAFEPGDASKVYINYTRGTEYYRPFSANPTQFPASTAIPPDPKRNRIARFGVNAGVMDMNSEEIIYETLRPYEWHTLNSLVFDSNGYLYSGSGDGGYLDAIFDSDRGQGTGNELATIIRIDPNAGAPGYTIPPGNPFADGAGPNADEVWAYGFRNPWRVTLDRQTGQLWAGDVGEYQWEEVNKVQPGANYGWVTMEGNGCHIGPCTPPPPAYVPPRAVYCTRYNNSPKCEYDNECAVIGGYVYRGSLLPGLYGHYIYSDFCSGVVREVNAANQDPATVLFESGLTLGPTAFAETPSGEILLVNYDGTIYQLDYDADGDGVGALADNCPNWDNPLQESPAWPIPPGDSDCDGFSDSDEAVIGTDALAHCPADSSHDAWPPDFNRSGVVSITDVLFIKPYFGQAVPPAPSRYDLQPGAGITVSDVLEIRPFFTKNCAT